MGFFRGAVLLAASLVLILGVTFFVVGIAFWQLLSPQLYIQAIEKSDLKSTILNKIENSTQIDLTEADSSQITIIIERLIKNFLWYIKGEKDELNLTVKIDKETMRSFLVEHVGNMTFCDEDINPFEQHRIKCRPKDKTPSESLEEILERKNLSIISQDYIDLKQIYGIKDQDIRFLRRMISISKNIFFLSLLASLLAVFVILISNRKSIKKTSGLIGANLALAGGVILIIIFLLESLFDRFSQTNLFVEEMLIVILDSLKSKLFTSIIIIVLVAVFLLAIYLLRKKEKRKDGRR